VSVTRLRKESEVFAESTRRAGVDDAFGVAVCERLSAPPKNDAAESRITCHFDY
jgi:hypothetical protein